MKSSQPFKPLLIFSVLSALFVLSMFYRVSNAVIAPNLIEDLGLNAETLGILGGAFFIGVGMSSVLMGSFKVFALRFRPVRFATLVGILLSIGTLGNILAASPLAYLTTSFGWRMTFILAGGITALLAFLIFWILKEEKVAQDRRSPTKPEISILSSIRLILGSLVFLQIGAVAFFRYGTFVSLQGLWLAPYLIDTQRYSPVQTGNLLIFLAIGIIVGSPIAGRLSDQILRSRKGVALPGLVLYALSLFSIGRRIRS